MAQTYGGLFVHCCAAADHQYGAFKSIPHLRGINRVFQDGGPGPAIAAFSGRTVLIQAWMSEEQIRSMLEMARPDTRMLINMGSQPLEEAKRTFERLRERCGRL